MFIEGRNDVKIRFHIHVDVATKLIIGQALRDKTDLRFGPSCYRVR